MCLPSGVKVTMSGWTPTGTVLLRVREPSAPQVKTATMPPAV